jgi:hypothetical protein
VIVLFLCLSLVIICSYHFQALSQEHCACVPLIRIQVRTESFDSYVPSDFIHCSCSLRFSRRSVIHRSSVSALIIFKRIELTDMASLPKKCFRFKRSAMYQTPSLNVDFEDSILDISTAPTTPDGSLTFSPVLQALKLQDALEDASSKEDERKGSASLDATLYFSPSGIKNVCCVGAGYVGPSLSNPLSIFNTYSFVYQAVQQQP